MPHIDPAEHVDPADLALLALGELPDVDLDHLQTCDECQAHLEGLRRVADLGRSALHDLPDVPPQVWVGITEELGLAPGGSGTSAPDAEPGAGAGRFPVVPSAPEPPGDSPPDAGPAAAGTPHDAGAGGATITTLPARRRTAGLLAAAAAVGALVGGGVVWAATSARETPGPTGSVVAEAVLTPISDSVSVTGTAEVLETRDGLMVRIDARGLPAGSGFHEVWLLDRDGKKLVALGALPSGSVGSFTVPPGIEIADFPVVDISIEPYDGDPSHSHDSLLRGTLEA